MTWFRVTYNSYSRPASGWGHATSGLLEHTFQADDRGDAFKKLYDGVLPRAAGEGCIFYDVIECNYELPENYQPIPFDEVEAAL